MLTLTLHLATVRTYIARFSYLSNINEIVDLFFVLFFIICFADATFSLVFVRITFALAKFRITVEY